MKVILHPLVHLDIAEAMEFYEREGGSKLAADFFREYESVVKTIGERSVSFPLWADVLRRTQFRRFPFHILFSIEPSYVFILVVRHDRRHPDFGLDR